MNRHPTAPEKTLEPIAPEQPPLEEGDVDPETFVAPPEPEDAPVVVAPVVEETVKLQAETKYALVTMCSAHQRYENLARMIESYAKTSRCGEAPLFCDHLLAIYVSDNDPNIAEFKKIKLPENVSIEYGPYKTMVQVLNYFSTDQYPGCRYYSEVNDDHVYQTEGWDVAMIRAIDKKNSGLSIAYGQTQNLPTATMHGGKLINLLGYFFPPKFEHSAVDLWLMRIGKEAGLLTYVRDVMIEHKHPTFGKAKADPIYEKVVAGYTQGNAVFEEWVKNDMKNDVNKLLAIIETERTIKRSEISNVPDLAVMMTTFGREALLSRTVDSYNRVLNRPKAIYVFDDESKNRMLVRSMIMRIPEATFVLSDGNLGVHKNNCRALKSLFDAGAGKVLVLDSDCLFSMHWWEKLQEIVNTIDLTKNIVCLFNAKVHPSKPSVFPGLVEKTMVGGLGLLVTKDCFEKHILHRMDQDKEKLGWESGWDGDLCRYAKEDGMTILACSPSMLQHTGIYRGEHSNQDAFECVAADFDGINRATSSTEKADAIAKKYSFPAGFGPNHPLWQTPSFRGRWQKMQNEIDDSEIDLVPEEVKNITLADTLKRFGLSPDFGPSHRAWNIPSKRQRYDLVMDYMERVAAGERPEIPANFIPYQEPNK